MPFILLCGFPSSGKTSVSKTLEEYFVNKNKRVQIISDDFDKNEVYASSIREKGARGDLKSKVERQISRNDILILDSSNYIKGFRYELFCFVKAHKTLHCVIHCASPSEKCWEWNLNRNNDEQYNKDVFDALVMRFETPESRCRWDNPLFTVFDLDSIPLKEIDDGLFQRKAAPPNQSTMQTPLSSTNFLQELDRITQDIILCILDRQKTAMIGESICVGSTTIEKIYLTKTLNMSDLRRLKRQFITYSKMHPVEDTAIIGSMFVKFINNQIKIK